MRMDPGIDTGPVLSQRAIPILPDDTSTSLSERLARVGAELFAQTLPGYLNGSLQPRPQDEVSDQEPTYAPMLKKEDGLLDFGRPAEALERMVRAFNPWPGAYTYWEKLTLKIIKAHVVEFPGAAGGGTDGPGKRLVHQGLPAFNTSQGLLVIDEIQPAGKKPMAGEVFIRGAHNWE
jgi:methionyl-tRNA formyltransferase